MNWNNIGWRSPSNIALVKYWGKHGNQLPSNPSLSLSLSECYSEMKIRWQEDQTLEAFELEFTFEGEKNEGFRIRIYNYLKSMARNYPFLNKLRLVIDSSNSFPHSSGVASSASSMSALALCIGSIAIELGVWNTTVDMQFKDHCSKLARLASGSASRSLFGNYVQWGYLKEKPDMTDDHAVPVTGVHRNFQSMYDAILIVSSRTKKQSSTQGHALMEKHPFAQARYEQARKNLRKLHVSLSDGDFDTFIEVVENEALTLHALMMSSQPGYFELLPNSLAIIDKIRKFRNEFKLPLTFTIDAGPNIHLLYPLMIRDEVLNLIGNDLVPLCENDRWIDDKIGNGPEQIT